MRGVVSGAIIGNPVLPPGWRLVTGYLVGPGASLSSANLSGTDLTGIDLTRTALTNADLSGANLTATNLTDAALTGADVTGAVWSNTTCPNGAVERALHRYLLRLPIIGPRDHECEGRHAPRRH